MIRGQASDGGEVPCTAVPFAVETLLEVPLVREGVISLFEVVDSRVPFEVGVEEPGSFR